MALARETPLLTTVAEVVDITSVQDLANLEADSEFAAADTLAESHRWVYDRLKHRVGSDALASLSNQTELKRAVAYRLLETLAAGGYLGSGVGPDYWSAQAREEVDGFRPEFSDSADEARTSAEDVPVVANFDAGWVFGPTSNPRRSQRPWKARGPNFRT